MLNLLLGARPDEQFHLQRGQPTPHVIDLKVIKFIRWSNLFLPDGTPGYFHSWWVFGNAFHWYRGNVKCDGSRTRWDWGAEDRLDDGRLPHYIPDPDQYVMTTTPKEKFSVRLFVDPALAQWDVMGGA